MSDNVVTVDFGKSAHEKSLPRLGGELSAVAEHETHIESVDALLVQVDWDKFKRVCAETNSVLDTITPDHALRMESASRILLRSRTLESMIDTLNRSTSKEWRGDPCFYQLMCQRIERSARQNALPDEG
ncbi:MAG: hypothetical protein MN733_27665 [Nitrososphaera sp.]|nr:hypothetical protein [Nitrososphaera sp.]